MSWLNLCKSDFNSFACSKKSALVFLPRKSEIFTSVWGGLGILGGLLFLPLFHQLEMSKFLSTLIQPTIPEVNDLTSSP